MHPPLARAAWRSRGAVVLALTLVLAALLPLALWVTGALPRPEETARQRSVAALHQARAALIARAIKGRRDDFSSAPLYRPGALPCPDVDDDGGADGSHCVNYVGRLPFKTLEIDDLRDGSGERLWYVLSPNFRPALFPTPATLAQLRLRSDERHFAALLIAAGPVIGAQSRGCEATTHPAGCARLQVTQFLEGLNAHTLDSPMPPNTQLVFEGRAGSGRTEAAFNDLVLGLTPSQFMPQVQQRVAREALGCLRALGVTTDTGDVWLEMPSATAWALTESLCRGIAPYEYFEAWRGELHYQHHQRLRVRAGDVIQCEGMGGASC
ncbi:MAG: hypothetical protein FJY37_05805 [Betaproteobacteria bacterium]|nr:hypothetical protein [Betaproteobacteria bacterium]